MERDQISGKENAIMTYGVITNYMKPTVGVKATFDFNDWVINNICPEEAQDSLETFTKRARLYKNSSNPATTQQSTRKMVHDEMNASEYLNQLLQDKTTVSKMPKIFLHSERLLDEEINRVRNDIFCPSSFLMLLPKPQGTVVKLTEKVYAKVKDYPKFNFVGRIIGPRGLTLRQVEQETGCKLLVRGRGSMKDKKVEEEKRGQSNYEHLEEDLHVLIMVDDTEERARLKLQKSVEEVNFLLTPPKDGEDDIKKKQLQDLAILNGTYRPPCAGDVQHVQNVSATFPAQNGVSTNRLLNFPSPTSIITPNTQTYPPVQSNTVSAALQGVYPIDSYTQRGAAASFLDFTGLDSNLLLAGKR